MINNNDVHPDLGSVVRLLWLILSADLDLSRLIFFWTSLRMPRMRFTTFSAAAALGGREEAVVVEPLVPLWI